MHIPSHYLLFMRSSPLSPTAGATQATQVEELESVVAQHIAALNRQLEALVVAGGQVASTVRVNGLRG